MQGGRSCLRDHGVIAILGKLIRLLSLGNLKRVPNGLNRTEIGLCRSHVGGSLLDLNVEEGCVKLNEGLIGSYLVARFDQNSLHQFRGRVGNVELLTRKDDAAAANVLGGILTPYLIERHIWCRLHK